MPQQDKLDAWVEKFPYEEILAEIEGLQTQVQGLNNRLFALMDLKQMYERIRAFQPRAAEPQTAQTMPEPSKQETGTLILPKMSLRDAIRSLIATDPKREWSSDELWDELTTRNWLRRDKQGKANMFAMLSVMTHQGELERVKRGVYRATISAPDMDLLREVRAAQ